MVGRLRYIALAAAARFVIDHEKGLVVAVINLRDPKRPGQHSAEIVLSQAVFLRSRLTRRVEIVLEIIFGVEDVVAQEFERRAVPIVAARFGDDVDLRARVEAVLGRIAARQHAELLHGLDRRAEGNRVDARFGRDDAVERALLIGLALAVGDERQPYAGNRNAVRALTLTEALAVGAATRTVLHPRLQDGQRAQVAVVERQLLDSPLFDRLGERRVVGAQSGSLGDDLDLFGSRADLQGKIHADFFVDFENDATPRFRPESLRLDRHVVDAYVEQREAEIPRRRCRGFALHTGFGVGGRHLRAGDHGALGIGHRAQDRC